MKTKKTHYILILDDSASMGGTPWQQATKGAIDFMKQVENQNSDRISIIIFDHQARIVVG